jgi:hypothetical protein
MEQRRRDEPEAVTLIAAKKEMDKREDERMVEAD